MKMMWRGLKIKENCHVSVNQFHGDFRSKTLSFREIKSVFRDVKWCFNASWGLKGLRVKAPGHWTYLSLYKVADAFSQPLQRWNIFISTKRPKGLLQFEIIIISYLALSASGEYRSMKWVYGHYICFIISARGSSTDVRFWRLKSDPRRVIFK